MGTGPRTTIIMPAYNAAHFIGKAVESALSQTERDTELLIVDDGSSDQTPDVVRELARLDERIRPILLTQNSGAAHALNVATRAARGKWIARIDADDWYEPARLERLIEVAEAEQVQMIADNQILFDLTAGQSSGLAFPNLGRTRRIDLSAFFEETDPTALFDYGMLKPIFLKSFIREHRVFYREGVRHGEDYFVLLDFFVKGGQGLIFDEPLYWYVQPFGSISRQWAKPNGRRYPFEHMKAMNDRVVEEMHGRLSEQHLKVLISRSEAIEALACLHQVREHLRMGNFQTALSVTLSAPARFWTLCAQRISEGLLRLGARLASHGLALPRTDLIQAANLARPMGPPD